jgi:hypothetical protein
MENFLTNALYPACAVMATLSLIVIALNSRED